MIDIFFYGLISLSVLLNVLLIWYIIRLLRNLIELTDEHDRIRTVLLEFSSHLEVVSNMETYYGDNIIENLVKHMKSVSSEIEEYTDMMVLYGDDEVLETEEQFNDNKQDGDNPDEA
tara:strand:+ start:79 stop:429 length:351 start_codon:yes stop_codon:yes gene_type:complete